MERDDWDRVESCAACGGAVSRGTERGFAFGLRNVLCWGCAVERGGRYDALRDEWTEPPEIADLPDEAYGDTADETRGG